MIDTTENFATEPQRHGEIDNGEDARNLGRAPLPASVPPCLRGENDLIAAQPGPHLPSPVSAPDHALPAQTTPPVPAAVRRELTARQREEAGLNLRLLLAYVEEFARCQVMSRAAARVGLQATKLYRFIDWLQEAGVPMPQPGEVLTVERAEALIHALAPGLPTGQPMKYPLTELEALALRACVLARSTENATHFAVAVEDFANLSPAVPGAPRAEIREIIREELDRAARKRRLPNWPTSIRRAGMPNITEGAWFRGPKHVTSVEQVDRRGLWWVDEQGARRPLRPHSIREMDDQSDNQPRTSIDPESGEVILTRQAFWSQDVYSAALLSLHQIARPRDAYRIEDVADFVRLDFEAHGAPEILRLEMGDIWNGRFFHGFVPMYPNTRQVIPGWGDQETWGSLSPICRVVNVHKSKGKGGIEKSFDMVQTLAAHQALDIGRSRGEFEEATKALVRRATEIDVSFWSMEIAPEAMRAVARRFNQRGMIRRAFGRDTVVPADLLGDARGALVLPGDAWRLCPIKRVATVRGGAIELSVDHYPRSFRFRINGVDDQLHLDNGYTVLIAFHPGRPVEGCHVFNAECGSRNRYRFGRGQKILCAPYAEEVAQVDLSGHGDFSPRKKANASVRRAYRAITNAVKEDYAQDSAGKYLRPGIDAHGQRYVESHPPLRGGDAAEPQPSHRREAAPSESMSSFYGD